MKNFIRTKVVPISEIPKIIKCINNYGLKVLKLGIGGDYRSLNHAKMILGSELSLSKYIYIEVKETILEITTRQYEHVPCTYKISLNEEDIIEKKGQHYFSVFQKYFKVPKIINEEPWNKYVDAHSGKFMLSASPIIDFNPKYNKQELKDCYEYDINSAYSSVQLDKIPDLEHPIIGFNVVGANQVGFCIDEQLTMVREGFHADVIFNLIDCPAGLKEFITKYYNQKKTTTGHEKNEAKAMLNLPIGYCQRYNPFFRAYVVHSCNEKIFKLIDDDTLFWNTDAIFTRVKRNDLDIGDKIGQFKEIKCDTIRYDGNVYQINDEIPVYRGIPKKWFEAKERNLGRKYNLLIDGIPEKHNIYKWNWETLELEVDELWQNVEERN